MKDEKMKRKIFSICRQISNFFLISDSTLGNTINWANLVCLSFTKGHRYHIRNEISYGRSKDFFENYLSKEGINEKIKRLKNGLDMESQTLIDKILRRQKYIFRHNLVDIGMVLDPEEIKEQKIIEASLKKLPLSRGMKISPEVFFYHHGLKFLPDNVLKNMENKDAIDGGAYVGDSAIVFSREYRFKKIYSFEPGNRISDCLRSNIKKYNLGNVIAVNKGIGSQEGIANLEDRDFSSSIHPQGKEQIDMTTVDNFVKKNNLDVGLIKFDIEGLEYDGLIGSLDTIRKFKPVLLVSLYHSAKDFFEIKPYLEGLDLGYNFMVRKLNPSASVEETMLVAYV